MTTNYGTRQADTFHPTSQSLACAGLDPAPLTAAPLDPAGAFALVNALRPVPPLGGSTRLLISFCPEHTGRTRDLLCVLSAKSRLRLELTGEGVAPRVELRPAGAALDLGDVLAGDAREAHFTVANTSPFPVTFGTRFVGAAAGRARAKVAVSRSSSSSSSSGGGGSSSSTRADASSAGAGSSCRRRCQRGSWCSGGVSDRGCACPSAAAVRVGRPVQL